MTEPPTQEAPATAPPAAAAPPTDWHDPIAVLRRLGPAAPLALASVTLPAVGMFLLYAYLPRLAEWLRAHQENGVLIYVGTFALMGGMAILPTNALTALGGWTFGFDVGFPTVIVGLLAGALIGYGVARWLTGHRIEDLINERPLHAAVYRALLRSSALKTVIIVTLVRLTSSPFGATNILLAAMRVPLWAYCVGTVVGLAPRAAVLVVASAQASDHFDPRRGSHWLLLAVGIAVTLAVLGIIAWLARRAIHQVTAEHTAQPVG